MSKPIRRRVEQLEERLGPDEPRDDGDARDWLESLDEWPEEFLGENSTKKEIAEVREECRKIAARVRSGELTTSGDAISALPMSAILGLRLYLERNELERNEDEQPTA